MVLFTSLWSLVLSNLILPLAVLIFARAFYPFKVTLPGMATNSASESLDAEPAPFDKLIFVVIDALRR